MGNINTSALEKALSDPTGEAFGDYWDCNAHRLNSNGSMTFTGGEIVQHLKVLLDARNALAELMPFAEEDYYPDWASPEFKHAIELSRIALLPQSLKVEGEK